MRVILSDALLAPAANGDTAALLGRRQSLVSPPTYTPSLIAPAHTRTGAPDLIQAEAHDLGPPASGGIFPDRVLQAFSPAESRVRRALA